jgi:hypothetical protein
MNELELHEPVWKNLDTVFFSLVVLGLTSTTSFGGT